MLIGGLYNDSSINIFKVNSIKYKISIHYFKLKELVESILIYTNI